MSQDKIKDLNRKRGSVKHRLTTFKTFIGQYIAAETIELPIISEIQLRVSKIEGILGEFQEIQNEIECLVEENAVQDQYEKRDEFEQDYYSILNQANLLISKHTIPTENSAVSVSGGSQQGSVQYESLNINNNSIKLPSIDLPKFSGDYQHWLEFKDTFESLIHNNVTISPIQKFHYLRSSLSGSAAQNIHFLEFTANNYEVAWNNLYERYNNNRLLIHHHVKALFELGNVKKDTHFHIRQLIDRVMKHLQSLEALGEPTKQWDTLVIYLICNKLDDATAKEWESFKGVTEKPTLDDILKFLKGKADQLEALSFREIKSERKVFQKKCNLVAQDQSISCYHCSESHAIYKCKAFLKLTIPARIKRVKELKLCENCLSNAHSLESCVRGKCKVCKKAKHNSLLHQTEEVASHVAYNGQTLLATACVEIPTSSGQTITARTMLDSGSQCNIICQELWDMLGMDDKPTSTFIIGIANSHSEVQRRGTLTIRSKHTRFSKKISCYILKEITDDLPAEDIDTSKWNIPQHIRLADPTFFKKGKVQLLLGAGIFWTLLYKNNFCLKNSNILLQNTALGWIVSGPTSQGSHVSQCSFTKIDVQRQLEQFWKIEDLPKQNLLSPEEQACESIFVNTFSRGMDGKFTVTIPFKESPTKLGDSKALAIKRFQSLERKFNSNPNFKSKYQIFMKQYEDLGHMSKVDMENLPEVHYFLPHHGVINENSSSTKLRVVFDGSCKSTSGISLNELQMIGPTIQDDLLSIMLRFRVHNFVIAADVKMMYREIWVNPTQRALQMIVWRADPTDRLQAYTLNTVTYGTASAPFLAIRCLQQVAKEMASDNQKATETILSDFYVDDLVSGGSTIEETTKLANDISKILSSAGFLLRKWVSNDPSVLNNIQQGTTSSDPLYFGNSEVNKTLGLYWISKMDVLTYSIPNSTTRSLTKRALLSDISKIFDIMGLLAPCVIIAKIMLQELWSYNLAWDDSIPPDLERKWWSFRQQLTELNHLHIPRKTISENSTSIQLHGFADASQDAYAACVYLRSVDNNRINTNLLCAKAKVAPLKQLSIPRLELCAALLLSELVDKVKLSIKLKFSEIFLWSDSTITLHWIRTAPNLLQVFVANRVAKIQTITEPGQWHHVRSDDNPADLASRGIQPEDLSICTLWWQGPNWLSQPETQWPKSLPIFESELPEMKKSIKSHLVINDTQSLFQRFSTFNRLKRVIAYCFRFIKNCKTSRIERLSGPLNPSELAESLRWLVKVSQAETFAEEIKLLKNSKSTQIKGNLRKLNLFIDDDGILRVGGRLENAILPFAKKHPIVISAKHQFTKLLFASEHLRLFHAAPQLLLSSIRDSYWPIAGRSLSRSIVHQCVRCTRLKPTSLTPQMGNLPKSRVTPNLPFTNVGIDFAGPILIKDRRGRGSKTVKCYICLFVCFSTRAIHLEAVTDLTTQAFLACFRRFCSRRGKPSNIYSDNSRNFTGANTELKRMYAILANECSIRETLSNDGISWHFLPPHSPHQGGLWEAGVRSTKHHLKRVLGNALVTYEDFMTILTQVEAILNSRPITSLSSDPFDYEALTPSHFLIGRKLISAPDPNVSSIPENRLSVYQRIQALQQHFWARWSKEYISELQERQKWTINQHTLQIGMLVTIKDDNLPPLLWKLGRVIQIFPGTDGIARVADVQTQSGVVRRSFSKLCPLPTSE